MIPHTKVAFKLFVRQLYTEVIRQMIDDHKPNVVTRTVIFLSWVPKTDDTFHILTSYNVKKGDGKSTAMFIHIIILRLSLLQLLLFLHLQLLLRPLQIPLLFEEVPL